MADGVCERCGYCCTHFIMPVALSEKFSDEDARDLMKFLSYHGPVGRIETARSLNGFLYKDNTPCRHYDRRTKLCKVHDTPDQPEMCKNGFCDRARNKGMSRESYVTGNEAAEEVVKGEAE